MKSTEYLFGKPRSVYEPHITLLAKRRIMDANYLLIELARQRDLVPKDELDGLIARYKSVEIARNWWIEILEEE
jgi:hypothetical protein